MRASKAGKFVDNIAFTDKIVKDKIVKFSKNCGTFTIKES